ncbi:MAG: TlpA family protein disulfide reductase [Lewinellaceae bacterium]|nr:TlpA family protein disulfide reductase [Lewinellaceae bacterium]
MFRSAAIIVPLLLLLAAQGQAQQVPFIKSNQIEYWKHSSSDTIYVFNFWATWCGPCVKELPNFDVIQEKYAGRNVKVVLISTDFKKDAQQRLQAFIEKNDVDSEVMFMDESNPNNYIDLVTPEWSGALPATLVLCSGRKKEIFHEGELSLEELDDMVRKAL